MEPSIGILPYELGRFGFTKRVRVGQVRWITAAPPVPADTLLSALEPSVHLMIYPNRFAYVLLGQGGPSLSLLIAEPSAIHRRHVQLALAWQGRFFRILTFYDWVLKRVSKARFLSPANAWVDPGTNPAPEQKTRLVSVIASAKRKLEGHRLRHDAIAALRAAGVEPGVFGRGYVAIERKEEGLVPFRYSVVIENSREPDYITEKLIDCLLCNTVPIYWGAPNVGEYFDLDGMIVCTSLDEIVAAAANLSEEDYLRRLPAIAANRQKALAFVDFEANAVAALRAEIAGAPGPGSAAR